MNFSAITRRIRRCESEVPAQLVFEFAIKQAVEAEREACARTMEVNLGNDHAAAVIRARSNPQIGASNG